MIQRSPALDAHEGPDDHVDVWKSSYSDDDDDEDDDDHDDNNNARIVTIVKNHSFSSLTRRKIVHELA